MSHSAILKSLLPEQAVRPLKSVLEAYRGVVRSISKRFVPLYIQALSFCVKKNKGSKWCFEKLLSLLFANRPLNESLYCNRFLYYFNLYKENNPDCILKWGVKAGVCNLMLNNIPQLEKTMEECVQYRKVIRLQKGLEFINFHIAAEYIFEYYNVHAYLDVYIKSMKLGWVHEHVLIVLLREGQPVLNPCMLEYWKKYIRVISDVETCKLINNFRLTHEYSTSMVANVRGEQKYIEHAKSMVQKEWEIRNYEPLHELTEEHKQQGSMLLNEIGLPKGSWFVSLHVRDAGFKTGSYKNKEAYDGYRNSDIDTYKLAIHEIVERGGFVIRVGDPNMKPVDKIDGLFDYAHSDFRSNEMDIFLFSQCRFFLGVSSGPVLTPVLFGTPVVMTNFVPMSGRPHASNCLFIPKLLWLENEDRYASLEEVLSTDLSRIFTNQGYTNRGIALFDNTPEQIRDVSIEMLDRLEGAMVYTEEDELRQEKVSSLYRQFSGYGDLGRMGNLFLQQCEIQNLI